MNFFKISKRENEHERCLCLWTPWATIVWDFGSVQCRGTDEFELVIKYKAWGPVFYWGNRDVEKLGERSKFDGLQFVKIQPRYAELRRKRIEERDFYENREQQIRQGKRRNPANMTYEERHAETLKSIAKMKFSNNFVHLMTTPVCRLALERGEICHDSDTGELLTEEMFYRDKASYKRLSPPNVGLLGFKKAEDGEGYTSIVAREFKVQHIQDKQKQIFQLESER